MAEKLGICLIGCGRAGMIHARSYAGSVPGAELVALCDPMEENLRLAQEELPVERTYTDYNDVMDDDAVDAVVVVTPTQFHRDIVVAAARAGKHVFCEKPMASSAEECDEMIEACAAAGVKLQLGFMRRFDASFRRGKELIEEGAVGEVAMLKSNTYGPSEPKEWMYDVRKNQGPIGEVCSHDFDIIRWYAGAEAKYIYAMGNNTRSPEVAEQWPEYYDSCTAMIEFENGVLGVVTGAQYVRYGYDARTEILGTHGIVKVGSQRANNVELVGADRRIHVDSMDSWRTLFKDAYVAEATEFVKAIREDSEPIVTGYDGKQALLLVDAGVRSILEGRKVEIGVD